jgi:hypothetical protein
MSRTKKRTTGEELVSKLYDIQRLLVTAPQFKDEELSLRTLAGRKGSHVYSSLFYFAVKV